MDFIKLVASLRERDPVFARRSGQGDIIPHPCRGVDRRAVALAGDRSPDHDQAGARASCHVVGRRVCALCGGRARVPARRGKRCL